eukprot:5964289-Prymnesium_polylepis.1
MPRVGLARGVAAGLALEPVGPLRTGHVGPLVLARPLGRAARRVVRAAAARARRAARRSAGRTARGALVRAL